jgi:four helix bundle protein
MGDYRQLAVWQRAYALTTEIYRSTRPFPNSERYGLTAQMRRAAISILSNIAEGSGRQTDREQVRFLRIARGSTCELECQLLLSRDVGYLKPGDWLILDSDCREVGRMLTGLIKSLQSRQ